MRAEERNIMELIVHAGNARSSAMEAINLAKTGRFDKVPAKLEEAERFLSDAHEKQNLFMEKYLDGEQESASMLLIHAQDHLMSSLTVYDLAREFCELYRRIQKGRGEEN